MLNVFTKKLPLRRCGLAQVRLQKCVVLTSLILLQFLPLIAVASEPAPKGKLWRWLKPARATSQAAQTQPAENHDHKVAPQGVSEEAVQPLQQVSLEMPADTSRVPPVPPAPDEAAAYKDVTSYEISPGTAEIAVLPQQNVYSLEDLSTFAEMYHPRLTTAFRKIQSAQGATVQAGLYPNPRISASSPQIDGNESQYNGFISQEIVTARKLKISAAAAQTAVTQAQYEWQQERFIVLTELRQKYYAVLAAQKRTRILEELVSIATRSLEISERLFKAGEGAKSDILLLDIERRRSEVALQNAQTIYNVGKKQLTLLVACPALNIQSVSGDLNAEARNYQLDEIQVAAANFHPQASIARLEIERMSRLLQRARVEPVPNFDVMGGYQRQIGVPAENQGLFQVTMSVPLWNQNQGNISSAEASLSGARADLQKTELELSNLAAQAYATYETSRQLVEKYHTEILPQARETLAISQTLYAQGQIDFLRLLQSQRTLLETELASIEAQEQYWISAAGIAGLLQENQFP